MIAARAVGPVSTRRARYPAARHAACARVPPRWQTL